VGGWGLAGGARGARSGCRRGGASSPGRDRRRPPAADVDGARDARSLHARIVRPARHLVLARDGLRRSARLPLVTGDDALTTRRGRAPPPGAAARCCGLPARPAPQPPGAPTPPAPP